MNMKKMMVIDVETAGGFGNPLVYDFGFKVIDHKGNEYASGSFVIEDVFTDYWLMDSAYYAKKIPQYEDDLRNGKRTMISMIDLVQHLINIIDSLNVTTVCAYNARFDINAMANTINNAGFEDFDLFDGLEIYDIWSMACTTLGLQKRFFKSVQNNEWVSNAGNPRTSAEIMWRYVSNEHNFEESHTGFEDVEIETQIMLKCFAQHKKMEKGIIAMPWKIVADEYHAWQIA